MTDGLDRRVQDVRAVLTEHADVGGEQAFVAVVCNGCGCTLAASTVEELRSLVGRDGWSVSDETGGQDYCGLCR